MLCKMKSLEFKKYMLDVDYSREDFVEKFPEARTFPQITMDGKYVGGFTELDAHLGLIFLNISLGQILSIIFFILGIILFYKNYVFKKK